MKISNKKRIKGRVDPKLASLPTYITDQSMFERLQADNENIENMMQLDVVVRMNNLLDSAKGEHSLQFKMYIQGLFDEIRQYLIDNPVEHMAINIDQSAYLIGASLINVIYKEMQFRDYLRRYETGIVPMLKWEIPFDDDARNRYVDGCFKVVNRTYTRVYETLSLMIDAFPELHSFKDSPIYRFQGVAPFEHKAEIERLVYVMGLHHSIPFIHEQYLDFVAIADYFGSAREIVIDNSFLIKRYTKLRDRHFMNDLTIKLAKYKYYVNVVNSNDNELMGTEFVCKYITKLISTLNQFEIISRDIYDTDTSIIRAKPELTKRIESYIDNKSILSPKGRPIVIPPKPWTEGLCEGGYHTIGTPLVPHNHGKKGRLPPEKPYLDGINRMQGTGFRINKRVFAVAKAFGVYDDNVPARRPSAWTPERYVKAKASQKATNIDRGHIMDMAEEYLEYESIFFPVYGDFRSRGYYRGEYLNPQGSDLSKGVLEFDTGYHYSAGGYSFKTVKNWHAVNVAGLAGKDDRSMKDRVRWCSSNIKKLRAIVDDPIENSALWLKADKPWQFLAAVFDYIDLIDNKETHYSHLPIGHDGFRKHGCR